MNRTYLKLLCGLCLAMVAPAAKAGSFTANFDDGLAPAGALLFGDGSTSGVVEATVAQPATNRNAAIVILKRVSPQLVPMRPMQ